MKLFNHDNVVNGIIGAVSIVFLLVGILGAVNVLPTIFVYTIAATTVLTGILMGTFVCCVNPWISAMKTQRALKNEWRGF
jgi:membrane-bound ClpP family serine protease